MAKDIGHVLSTIFIPEISQDFLAVFFGHVVYKI